MGLCVLYNQRETKLPMLIAQKNSPPGIMAGHSYSSNSPWIVVEFGEQLISHIISWKYLLITLYKGNSPWPSKENAFTKLKFWHHFVWLYVVFLCSAWLKGDIHPQHEHIGKEICKTWVPMSCCALGWLCVSGPRRNKRSYPTASAISPVLVICLLCSINLNITIVTGDICFVYHRVY